MRANFALLLCSGLAACAGADLSLGDGRAADSGIDGGMDGALPAPPPSTPGEEGAARLDFEPPRVIAELESEDVSDDDPSLTSDLLLLCFNSKRDAGMGAEDIWCTRRAGMDEAWGTPEPQIALNSEHRETGIALSFDGLSLWFSSDRGEDEQGLDVFVATRPTRDSAWSEPGRIPELSSQDDELVSSIDESERRLMLARRKRSTSEDDSDEDEGDYDIFLAERATQLTHGNPSAPSRSSTPTKANPTPFSSAKVSTFCSRATTTSCKLGAQVRQPASTRSSLSPRSTAKNANAMPGRTAPLPTSSFLPTERAPSASTNRTASAKLPDCSCRRQSHDHCGHRAASDRKKLRGHDADGTKSA